MDWLVDHLTIRRLKLVLILPDAMLVPNALWLQENEQNMHVEFCKFLHFSIFNCN